MSQEIRITDVIAHPLTQKLPQPTITSWGRYEHVSIVLVEVRTDAGITGVGECLARFAPRAYAELIESALKPRLVGQPAASIAAHWAAMRRALSYSLRAELDLVDADACFSLPRHALGQVTLHATHGDTRAC